ncbi:hypothetical protein P170DRAFT_474315 [Aspergillus steynii IBT 23096]|uniref:Uncharacterized protein n=1 Tax=Aspergillus steynii IBT 23096 TaxID=1392250 RepID=A0A2I2GD02_9EURO|nr:uncharacterized protein P170DRAFT_474315 [Aspergillus steynii IBT 23096]PLB50759.1 hypothetical protein P170DRAFT_474315 [Aspergillus steynii IBT 23096]
MQFFQTLLPIALLASLGAARPADSVVRDSEVFARDSLKSCIGKLQTQSQCTNVTTSPFACCPPMTCGSDKLCRF